MKPKLQLLSPLFPRHKVLILISPICVSQSCFLCSKFWYVSLWLIRLPYSFFLRSLFCFFSAVFFCRHFCLKSLFSEVLCFGFALVSDVGFCCLLVSFLSFQVVFHFPFHLFRCCIPFIRMMPSELFLCFSLELWSSHRFSSTGYEYELLILC